MMQQEIGLNPEEWKAVNEALMILIENMDNPQGICFQCRQPVEHKEQHGRCVYFYPCGHHYQGQLSKEVRQTNDHH